MMMLGEGFDELSARQSPALSLASQIPSRSHSPWSRVLDQGPVGRERYRRFGVVAMAEGDGGHAVFSRWPSLSPGVAADAGER
jgi:hypothetical protein